VVIHMTDVFDQMADKWPSAVVARTEIANFTGGMLSSKYCANLDSLNIGCPGRVRVGRKVGYPVERFVEWMRERSN
jgi:hypothetical protein